MATHPDIINHSPVFALVGALFLARGSLIFRDLLRAVIGKGDKPSQLVIQRSPPLNFNSTVLGKPLKDRDDFRRSETPELIVILRSG